MPEAFTHIRATAAQEGLMDDPRWDDPRERDDGRARVYDQRDRTDHDPRDGLMHDLDLPRGETRELVIDRERMHELNREDSRALAVVGAFRGVPERDLESDRGDVPDRDTIDHLRDEGLIRTIPLDEHDQAVVLTDEGRDLLDANRRKRDQGEFQVFYAGVNRPRELDHDAHLYTAYREEDARLGQEHGHVEVRRVVLEQDLKREYQNFLQDHNRNRVDSDGRPDRDEEEIRRWAQDHELPYFDDRVHFPDFRIEYEVDGREQHQDVEVLTPHHRGVAARDTVFDFWSVPTNLGPFVNSPTDDQQAYIGADRRTLYFASNRPGGFGGHDLCVTTRT
jgi:hypothetical protein